MVGETVITIGNAFGYENTVSVGIISALHRDVTLSDDQVYRNLIQTDACINPGNSGGPLINIDGELIGINVAVRAGAQGIGFALPIDEVKRVAAELLSTRRLASTWHGLVAVEQRARRRSGVVVAEVQPGSPAEAAGFRPGDELVRVGDLPIASTPRRRARPARCPAGPPGERRRSAGAAPRAPGPGRPARDRQRRRHWPPARPTTRSGGSWASRRFPSRPEYVAAVSPKLRGGLYVQAVLPGSPAAEAAIQKGDILLGMKVGTRHWETIRARQHPVRPATTRDRPVPERPVLCRPQERGPAAAHQPWRFAPSGGPDPLTLIEPTADCAIVTGGAVGRSARSASA